MNAEDRSSRGSFAGRLLERLFPNATNEPETTEQLIELLRANRELKELNLSLDHKVDERTAELKESNDRLRREQYLLKILVT